MRLILLSLIMALSLFSEALAEKRIALVIGNSDYATPGWVLDNPVNDAELLAGALETVGFEVHQLLDANKTEMEDAFQEHADRLKDAGEDAVGFFFFAGHGAQHRGFNYLVSTDATVRSAADLMRQPKLDLLMNYLDYAGNRTNFIVLDACRNNPLPASMRSAPQGLASSQRIRGTLIAYSTAPGMVAEDGTGRENSSYSASLAALVTQPGYSVETLFRVVATRVEDLTDGIQIPWTESGLRGEQDFCFAGCELVAEDGRETLALAEVITTSDLTLLQQFLQNYPDTRHRTFVENRSRQLEIEQSAADAIEQARADNQRVRDVLGVPMLISEKITPWKSDPMQITARLGMAERVVEADPAFEKLEDSFFVFFDEGSAKISPDNSAQIKLFAENAAQQHMLDNGPGSLSIIASCSENEPSVKICQDRGYAVRDALMENGIYDVALLQVENWGPIRQISADDSDVNEDALNRYAAVMLLSD